MANVKSKGSFYTPKALARWMVFYLSSSISRDSTILEPSCGDGIFVDALNDLTGSNKFELDAIELDEEVLRSIPRSNNILNTNFFAYDFLFWKAPNKYDLVIGNPPYIVKKLLSTLQAEQCKKIHSEHNLKNHAVSNIWTSFLLKSSSLLSAKGVIAFVLPAEILQVKYAEEIRNFLSETFRRLEIVTFDQLTFDNLIQDTVVVIGYKASLEKPPGIYIADTHNVDTLQNSLPTFSHLPTSSIDQKWTTGILDEEEICLVNTLSEDLFKSSYYCDSVTGMVTAANNYFIVNKTTLDKHHLSAYGKKVIQKGSHVNGCVDFKLKKFNRLKNDDIPCYLIDTNNIQNLSKELSSYLEKGVEQEIDQRYKCTKRKRWHDVPNIKKSIGFFFKRSHQYPKCIKNSAKVFVTDSAYQITMREGFNIESFIFSFYNSLTLLAAEMQGRYYGGGVLELTPNEFKNLPIPYTNCEDFSQFAETFEKKSCIDEILDRNDQLILNEEREMPMEQVARIRKAYKKMKAKRLKKH